MESTQLALGKTASPSPVAPGARRALPSACSVATGGFGFGESGCICARSCPALYIGCVIKGDDFIAKLDQHFERANDEDWPTEY